MSSPRYAPLTDDELGKLFNPHDIKRLLAQYDAKRARKAKARPKARK